MMLNRARYYNPGSGRFLSEDPIGFEAGDYNLFRYVGNKSIVNKDPSGENTYSIKVVFRFGTGYFGWTPIGFIVGGLGGSPLNSNEWYNIMMDRAYNLLRDYFYSKGFTQEQVNNYLNNIVGSTLSDLQITSIPNPPPQNSCTPSSGPELKPGN